MITVEYVLKAGDKAIYKTHDGTLIVDVLGVSGTKLTCEVISIEGTGDWVNMYHPGYTVVLGTRYMKPYTETELLPKFIESLNNLERILKQKS